MKTEPEILVAIDKVHARNAAPRTALPQRPWVSAYPERWLKSLKLPSEWRVTQASMETAVQRDASAAIFVFDGLECVPKHLSTVAASLAEKQRVSPDAFVVFFCGHGMLHNVAHRVQLLQPFPEPSKVEIACSIAEMHTTIQELVAKWQVLQMRHAVASPRQSPLDAVREIVQVTQDLREENGNLSAKRVVLVFGFSLRELAQLLGRTPQAVSKTPAADSLQNALSYFERIARLRLALKDDGTFRKWLRMENPSLGAERPLDFLRERKWQALADFVDDILTGAPG